MARNRAPSKMFSEFGVERPELRGAALKRGEHESSLAAAQVHDLRTKPVGRSEFVSERGLTDRPGEFEDEPVVHRGAVDNHGNAEFPPFEGLQNGPTSDAGSLRRGCAGISHADSAAAERCSAVDRGIPRFSLVAESDPSRG